MSGYVEPCIDDFQFITWQWVLTSFGGTIGGLIAFGVNFKQTESTGVSNAVYAVL